MMQSSLLLWEHILNVIIANQGGKVKSVRCVRLNDDASTHTDKPCSGLFTF